MSEIPDSVWKKFIKSTAYRNENKNSNSIIFLQLFIFRFIHDINKVVDYSQGWLADFIRQEKINRSDYLKFKVAGMDGFHIDNVPAEAESSEP